MEGAGWHHLNIKNGLRHDMATAYLYPALESRNLTLIDGAQAVRLTFTGRRCTGIESHQGARADGSPPGARSWSAVALSTRRRSCCCPGSATAIVWLNSASRSWRTCQASARTSIITFYNSAIGGNLYSVPDTTRRRILDVHVFADEICIFENGVLIATHILSPGRRELGSPIAGRFGFTFTPKHSSWLNLVEGFFSKFARSILRHIRISSKQGAQGAPHGRRRLLLAYPVVTHSH